MDYISGYVLFLPHCALDQQLLHLFLSFRPQVTEESEVSYYCSPFVVHPDCSGYLKAFHQVCKCIYHPLYLKIKSQKLD